jgi:hypothetical protein
MLTIAGVVSCSGTLVNNSANKLYYLTAKHCQAGDPNGIKSDEDYSSENVVFFWKAETACGSNLRYADRPGALRSSGARSVRSVDDTWLMELTQAPPADAGTFLAGYDATYGQPQTLYSIHHGGRQDRQYAIAATVTDESASWGPDWLLVSGFSEGGIIFGSSGSGLFDFESGRTFGVASGSGSPGLFDCPTGGGMVVNGRASYARLAWAWHHGMTDLGPVAYDGRPFDGEGYTAPRLAPAVSLQLESSSIHRMITTKLSWETYSNAGSGTSMCVASGDWSGNQASQGEALVGPFESDIVKRYSLACTNSVGTTTKSVTLSVSGAPRPYITFSQDRDLVSRNQQPVLGWKAVESDECQGVDAATSYCGAGYPCEQTQTPPGWVGSQPLAGQFLSPPLNGIGVYEWRLRCTGFNQLSIGSAFVRVIDPPPVTISLTASKTSLVKYDTVTLSWNVENSQGCIRTGAWSGLKTTAGSWTSPELTSIQTYSFGLSCSNSIGEANAASRTVTVTVNPLPKPTVNLTSNKSTALPGGQTTLSWWTTGVWQNLCTASGDWSGPRPASGSFTTPRFTLLKTYVYTLTCVNRDGEAASKTVNVSVALRNLVP